MKRAGLFVLAAVVALTATVGAIAKTSPAAGPAVTSTPAQASCATPRIAIMAPITGPAASIGREQRNWSRYAVSTYNISRPAKTGGIVFRLNEQDTQLDPAQASTVAQRLASDQSVLAVVGPAGSQEVEAAGPIFRRAGLAFVSPSATQVGLTTGRYPTFFRVVGNDNAQARTDAAFIATRLRAQRVVAIDDQTSYGKPLADELARQLRARRVSVSRESVPRSQTDFSALVTRISADTNVVFLAWQIASNAQVFAQQMKEQGKNATIFGSDGLFSPDFRISGAYVSAFWPDIKVLPAARQFVRGYTRRYGNFGTFGPPVYVATQAAINAVNNACRGDRRATRAEVLSWMKRTSINSPLIGRSITFDRRGDVRNASFFIYRFLGGQLRYIRVR